MIIAVILIITGMFLESIAQIILLTPLLLPIVVALGIDPVVFGIVMVISCEVGFQPARRRKPVCCCRITNLGIDKISVAVLPFLLAYIAVHFCFSVSRCCYLATKLGLREVWG